MKKLYIPPPFQNILYGFFHICLVIRLRYNFFSLTAFTALHTSFFYLLHRVQQIHSLFFFPSYFAAACIFFVFFFVFFTTRFVLWQTPASTSEHFENYRTNENIWYCSLLLFTNHSQEQWCQLLEFTTCYNVLRKKQGNAITMIRLCCLTQYYRHVFTFYNSNKKQIKDLYFQKLIVEKNVPLQQLDCDEKY